MEKKENVRNDFLQLLLETSWIKLLLLLKKNRKKLLEIRQLIEIPVYPFKSQARIKLINEGTSYLLKNIHFSPVA